MGVKWLTTYVRSIESIVSSSVRLSAGSSSNKEEGQETAAEEEDMQEQGPVTFVVDGWAFIFHVYLSHFGDGVRSLDYARYRSFLHATLDAWDAAGIHAVFVFDGPMLPAKLPTILARRGGVVASNAAYMRASPASRTSRRFQCDCGLVAPLIYPATIDALQSWKRKRGSRRRRSSSSSSSSSNGKGRGNIKVNGTGNSNGSGSGVTSTAALEIVFAQTEADGLVAELAEERRGYALSIDSDYFILCARGAASKGYLPLDRIEYVFEKDPAQAALEEEARAKAMAEAAAAAAAAASSGGGDDGFEQVPSRRRDRRRGGAGVGAALNNNGVPPPSSRLRASESPEVLEQGGEQLSCINVQAYSAHALARQLQLPPNLMPLFAALCGNDYTPALQSTLLFRDVAPGPQRVSAAAAILRSEWSKVVGGGAPAALAAARRRRAAGIDERSEGASSATATPTTASASKRTVTARESAAIASPSALANNSSSSSSSALDPVRAIVEAVVEGALASAPSPAAAAAASRYVSTGERRTLADSIIDSLATYSLLTHADAPYLASPSAGFFIPALRPRPSGSDGQQQALAAYRQAYMRGQLRPILVEAMTQRVFVATFFAEDPDAASVQATAARRLRRWLWAVLFDAWGMQWARESMDEPEVDAARDGDGDGDSGSEDPDEVISVDTDTSEEEEEEDAEEEEDFDNLPTRPGSAMDMHFAPAEPAVKPPPAVVEYVRRGDRLAAAHRGLALARTVAPSLCQRQERRRRSHRHDRQRCQFRRCAPHPLSRPHIPHPHGRRREETSTAAAAAASSGRRRRRGRRDAKRRAPGPRGCPAGPRRPAGHRRRDAQAPARRAQEEGKGGGQGARAREGEAGQGRECCCCGCCRRRRRTTARGCQGQDECLCAPGWHRGRRRGLRAHYTAIPFHRLSFLLSME
ncbi:hypothetical protein FA10DRAFT_60201 [Acaromyces ingoldii]|uniref:PIN domain-like protein n=1 Tax=Acaromyces ingoldii TaxID=215250 RepID=A0A316YPN7_9BASI|nr:hypothetical protein FA10DRAFT_60201 [Acaromyces ingoldii]PWN91112.1 hypothetical protein FA10DRAFT_60201 [Acaromyces ingoldii]